MTVVVGQAALRRLAHKVDDKLSRTLRRSQRVRYPRTCIACAALWVCVPEVPSVPAGGLQLFLPMFTADVVSRVFGLLDAESLSGGLVDVGRRRP